MILIYRQEYWSGLLFPSPGDLSDPRIEPTSLTSPVLADRIFPTSATWEAQRALFVVCAQSCPVLCHPMHCRTPAPLSMGFSRQEYWSGLPFPTPGDLTDPGKYKM